MRLHLLAGAFIAIASFAQAQEIHSLAISPDGATLLAAGDNRTLYTVDAGNLAVTDRQYFPEQIRWVAYSEDGKSVFLRSQERTFSARNATNFKERFSAENIVSVAYAPNARRLLLLENNYKGGVLHMVAATSGKKMLLLDMPDLRTDDIAVSDDGSRALILTNSESSDTEEKVQPGSDLKGYDKYAFRQNNDGYISKMVAVDLNAGSYDVADTAYRVSSPSQVRMLGDQAVFVNSVSDTGLVAADGTSKLVNLGDKYVSFARINDAGTQVVLTSNSKIAVHPLQNGAVGDPLLEVEAEDIPGPAERVTAMAEAADGTLYFATSAYRIWKLPNGSDQIEVMNVY